MSFPRAVADVVVATDAIKFFVVLHTMRRDFANVLAVPVEAVGVEHGGVVGLDANWLVKILKGESLGMMVAVLSLGHVLADEVVRHVAIIARCKGVMAGFLPRIIFVALAV